MKENNLYRVTIKSLETFAMDDEIIETNHPLTFIQGEVELTEMQEFDILCDLKVSYPWEIFKIQELKPIKVKI